MGIDNAVFLMGQIITVDEERISRKVRNRIRNKILHSGIIPMYLILAEFMTCTVVIHIRVNVITIMGMRVVQEWREQGERKPRGREGDAINLRTHVRPPLIEPCCRKVGELLRKRVGPRGGDPPRRTASRPRRAGPHAAAPNGGYVVL